MVAAIDIPHAEHTVELKGAWPADSAKAGPSIVQRTDEDFINATLAELAGSSPAAVVADHRPASDGDALRLYQPVHRTFNLVLVEAHCDQFMHPRLDPRKIDSAGIVVRRVRRDAANRPIHEGWCSANGQVLGWTPLPTQALLDRDPDPKRRAVTRLTADPVFDAGFRGPPDPTAEDTTSLFVAPADTVPPTTRTLLYGVIPVTSASRAGEPAAPENPPSQAEWSQHLVSTLKASGVPTLLGVPGGTLAAGDLAAYADSLFIKLLLQLRQEFGLFRADAPARAANVLARLNELTLSLSDGATMPAGDYLVLASRLLIDRDAVAATARVTTWPAVSADLGNRLYAELRPLAEDLRKALVAPVGSAGRFEDASARYVVRAFLRAKRPGGCPPRLVWSEPGEAFTIAPWHETGPGAPVLITLPDPFDRNFLKKAKPGVSFAVPEKLASFLNQDAVEMLKGNAKPGGGLTLDWICGFSIPIITICAFIMLSIILSLLNLIFFWLPFVKICIPFPRKK